MATPGSNTTTRTGAGYKSPASTTKTAGSNTTTRTGAGYRSPNTVTREGGGTTRSRSPFTSVKSGETRPPSKNSKLSAELANKDRKIVERQVAKGKALGLGAGWGEIFSDPARFNLGALKTFVGSKRAQGSLGLGGLPDSMLQQINRLQYDPERPSAGKPLSLVSAHRSDAYNTDLYKREGQKPTKSQHSTELPGRFGAVDLGDVSAKDMAGMITAAKRAGFLRSGTYAKAPTLLHLDMKPSLKGGYGPASPEVAAARLQKVAPTNSPKYLTDNYQLKTERLNRSATRVAEPSSPFSPGTANAAVPKKADVPKKVNSIKDPIKKIKNTVFDNLKSRFIGTKIKEGLQALGSTVAPYFASPKSTAATEAQPAKVRSLNGTLTLPSTSTTQGIVRPVVEGRNVFKTVPTKPAAPAKPASDPSRLGAFGGRGTEQKRQLKALVAAVTGSTTSPFKFSPPGEIFPLS